MFKKLLLTLIFCFFTATCFAQDYWVYIRTYDRSGVTAEDDKGRSKKGDIVDIRIADYKLSEAEKKEWLIIKTSDLTIDDIAKYKEVWEIKDAEGKIIEKFAYRKNKIDIAGLGLQTKPGENATKISSIILKNNISVKTSQDLIASEHSRFIYLAFQRPIYKIPRLILPYAWASTVVSTINKTGQDYDTLTLWEDAKDGDLVTATTIQEADVYDDDGVLTDSVTIAGSTTNASYYMYVTAPVGERHVGTAYGGGAEINTTTRNFNIQNNFTVIEWLIIESTGDYADENVFIDNFIDNVKIQNCILNHQKTNCYRNVRLTDYNTNIKLYNLIMTGASGHWAVECSESETYTAYNCSIVGALNGFEKKGATIIKNCYVSASGTCFSSGLAAGSGYNISSDATADDDGYPGCLISKAATNQFISVTVGSENLHLKVGADCIDAGFDLSGTFTIDIDGDLWGASWGIGADKYVAAGGATGARSNNCVINNAGIQ